MYIHIPENVKKGTYIIKLKAVSEGAKAQGQDIYHEITLTIVVTESQKAQEKEELMKVISILAVILIILNVLIAFVFISLRRNRLEKERYRTLYFMQKFSKNRLGKKDKNFPKTKPLSSITYFKNLYEDSEFDPDEQVYTANERIAILKYLRSTGKINEDQYEKGIKNIRKLIASKSPEEKNKIKLDTADIPDNDKLFKLLRHWFICPTFYINFKVIIWSNVIIILVYRAIEI